ncbi:hypothetical protein HK096_009572, partial [Nowakowskiella sp. JEL0078]
LFETQNAIILLLKGQVRNLNQRLTEHGDFLSTALIKIQMLEKELSKFQEINLQQSQNSWHNSVDSEINLVNALPADKEQWFLNKFKVEVKPKITKGSWDGSTRYIDDFGKPLTSLVPIMQQKASTGLVGARLHGLCYQDIIPFSIALRSSLSIQLLDLYDNNLGDLGALAIAEALNWNTSLEILYLSTNNIGPEGTKAISKSLCVNKALRLKVISLGNNNIGILGAKAFSEVLGENSSLQAVYLYSNNIGAEGTKAICNSLSVNMSLKILFFYSNNIGVEGIDAISEALQANHSLSILYLSGNNIPESKRSMLSVRENLEIII